MDGLNLLHSTLYTENTLVGGSISVDVHYFCFFFRKEEDS